MLPPEERLVGAQLHRYIEDKLYWVLHAPRQTGKTTFLQSWMREINSGDTAIACYVSVEGCQGIAEPERAMPSMCSAIRQYAGWSALPVPETDDASPMMLGNILSNWAKLVAPKPLVVLFDETDVLIEGTLISFLRQLRGGFADRGVGKFPVSIALVGMRDLKDYITAAKDGVPVNPGSPFNIKEDSAFLGNFSKNDIGRLFAQRTVETGQQITAEALDYACDQSQGQPWIVNSLFKRATMRILDESSTETITVEHIREAREQMILARETHLDALAYRLEDPQIRSVMETLMTGEPDPLLAQGEPFRLCLDLGLVTLEEGSPQVANPIYREVIARQMTYSAQLAIPKPEWKWAKPDGTLDMDALLKEFQKFWRNNSEAWEDRLNYPEAFPHLLLMAFLQRVANGEGRAMDGAVSNAGGVCDSKLQYSNRHGGRFEYEYAAGRGRMDLAVEYKGAWNIIEIKLHRKNRSFESVKEEGIRQILQYRDRIDPTAPCYLVIFDRWPEKPNWTERLTWKQDGNVIVVGC
jgi:hypothetical protein